MAEFALTIRCQRCGGMMELRDPLPGQPWRSDQFWVCPACGRHFWTTYVKPPEPPAGEPKAPAGTAPARTEG